MIDGSDGWWIDIRSFHHVYYDHAMFKTYTNTEKRNVLSGVSRTTNVAGIREVELKSTSEKDFKLNGCHT